MAYDDSFWVAIAASAPVIALAVIVSVTDVSNSYSGLAADTKKAQATLYRTGQAQQTRKTDAIVKAIPHFTNVYAFTWLSHIANIVIQAVVLALSLVSLMNSRNEISPMPAIVAEVFGVVLLVVCQLAGNNMQAYWSGIVLDLQILIEHPSMEFEPGRTEFSAPEPKLKPRNDDVPGEQIAAP